MPGLPRLRFGVAVLWTGSLWTVGVAAATLSAVLADRVLFGNIVSTLFRIEAFVGLAGGALMILLAMQDHALDARKRRAILYVAGSMLLCVSAYFMIQPVLAQIRAAASGPGGVMASGEAKHFGMLHGVSMLFYLLQAVLGAVLVRKNMG
jgi:hypothetical protein